ncbi:hypothetical protein ACGFIV_06715 [Sphaerisporangium sp. NPDC049003]|uniref:hypothetical protein n=1 Tax=Sphaerisporangium sp. NPDC049003 TaxID=3364517 RepID=UPI0037208F11
MTVALLEPENAMIEGRPDRAPQAMDDLPRGVGRTDPSTLNRAHLDRARALVRVGDSDKATEVMTRLRREHAEWLQYQQAGRDVTREILESRTRMPSTEQRDLADFLGLDD